MRMWNVDPKIMCRKHLLGEHLEMHMFLGSIILGKSVEGYLHKELLEIHNIENRHKELVIEMEQRGYNHKSPLIIPRRLQKTMSIQHGLVDKQKSLLDLLSRCSECRRNKVEEKFNT